jgi:hypothetical protein
MLRSPPPPQLIGGIVATGAPGISSINNKQDYVYVENLVHGFLKLEEALAPGSSVAGKVCTRRHTRTRMHTTYISIVSRYGLFF